MFVVREDTLRDKKDLLRAFLKGYRDSAAWMMANPEEAATLAGKHAIDGTQDQYHLALQAQGRRLCHLRPRAAGWCPPRRTP